LLFYDITSQRIKFMPISDLALLIQEINKLGDKELLNKLTEMGITNPSSADRVFQGLECLGRVHAVLSKNKSSQKDYSKMMVPGTPFTVEQAVSWLERAAEDYYNQGNSEITDDEYDWIYESLRGVVPGHPIFTKKIRAKTHAEQKMLLDNPVYSLFKIPLVYDRASGLYELQASLLALESWMIRVSGGSPDMLFCGSPKYDGLTMILYYVKGVLERAVTGGDGIEGSDVTRHAYEIENIPKTLASGETSEVRGEVVMRNSRFRHLVDKGAEFKFARGAAVGTLGLKDMAEVRRRGLSFAAWGYLPYGADFQLDEDEKFRRLQALGFEKVGHLGVFTVADIRERLLPYYQKLDGSRRLKVSDTAPLWEDAAMDGIVVTVNDRLLQESLGYSEFAPSFAAAFKFPGQFGVTAITKIDWQVNRTGVVKPVLNFDPVMLDGSRVTRATGDNFKRMERDKLSVGCKVMVTKAGLTIPKILAVMDRTDAEPFTHPFDCPSCGKALVLNGNEVDLICTNSDCGEQNYSKIKHYFDSVTSGKCGLGDSFLRKLVTEGLVKDIADLYSLDKNTLVALEGVGESKADIFLNVIEASKDMPFSAFVRAMSIPFVGEKGAIRIAETLGEDAEMLLSPSALTYKLVSERLFCDKQGQRRLPEEVVKNFCTWFAVPENNVMITRLKDAGVKLLYSKPQVKSNGQHFCVTGKTDLPKKELIKLFESKGFVFDSGVNKATNFLICNVQVGSSKQQKAIQHGVEIITETEALARLDNISPLGFDKQEPHDDIMNVDKDILTEKAKDLLNLVNTTDLDMFGE
jgi:DNA ligase (NAD+)